MICLLYKTHSLKLADPGKIVQTGLSAGSQSQPSIAWVQNILSKQLSDDAIAKPDWETAHAFFGCLFPKDFLVLSLMI